jgi:hypothetical protein
MKERKRRDSVTMEMAAPPETVYGLISDITRMGEWSPECKQCEWIDGATGPAVGARFKARNQAPKGAPWFNKPVVVAADAGREFAFSRSGPGIGAYTWHYRLEPIPGGTRVTESFEATRPLAKTMNWLTHKWTGSSDRDEDLRIGMETTLSRIKQAAETS